MISNISTVQDMDIRGLKENIEGLKKVAESFEGIFINMLFKEMRNTVNDDDGIFPKSTSEKMFQDMLDMETSNNLGKSKSFGIADSVIKSYERILSKKNQIVNKIA